MSDFNSMVFKYTIKESNKLRRLCEPLHSFFGINHFWYSRTTPDGGYFSIASNPHMHEYYHASKFHLYSPFFRHPDLIQPGFYLYKNIKDHQFQKTLDITAAKVNVHLGAGMVYKQGKNLIRFGYAVDPAKGGDALQLIHHLPLLQKFNAYFLNGIPELLKKAQDDLVHLPAEMGDSYYKALENSAPSLTTRQKIAFLSRLGLLDGTAISSLSRRELECLKYLHEGFTAPELALRLFISKRTVETHLASMKNKLKCHKKSDLFAISRLLHLCGFF